MDELLQRRTRPAQKEIPIAPILDMLVAIIFFLLLSMTFVEYSKQMVPPSRVSTIENPLRPPPIAPKLLTIRSGSNIRVELIWEGPNPGRIDREMVKIPPAEYSYELLRVVDELGREFKEMYPEEQTLQVGFGPGALYQDMISVMDALQPYIPDVVLISHRDTLALASGGM